MNETSKAVIIELSGGNVRNHHVNLRGAFGLFPDDCFGGSNKASSGKSIALQIAGETIETDIDEAKAIFRERSAIRRFFESETMAKGDLVLIERVGPRSYRVSKASKRGFRYYL
jgi:hypothetical protein